MTGLGCLSRLGSWLKLRWQLTRLCRFSSLRCPAKLWQLARLWYLSRLG